MTASTSTMGATDTTKTLQTRVSTENEEIMHVRGENEKVSLARALRSLQQAQSLLDDYGDSEKEWQDPVELLNTTALALDEAALALKTHDAIVDADKQQAAQLHELSEQVIRGRQAILDSTQQVVAGNRPTELWNPNTLIVYATHTGTSQDYAQQLESHLDGADVMNIKEVSLLDLQERKRVYFICSTFGLGRPPRDAEVVYTTLQLLDTTAAEQQEGDRDNALVASSETEALVGLEVAVAALGNSKFENFCQFGRNLSKRLSSLGAEEILPVTLLDAKSGKEEQTRQYQEWQQQVLDKEGVAIKESPIPNLSQLQKSEPVKTSCCQIM